ncbi:MAG: asparagine synthase (glutamine-hydrolyzing) [Deltaproteobacteria bacterium]|nr:asparagine synthase (glutamine-hydrolyzing) [Deltaproteobacteria bacterium]
MCGICGSFSIGDRSPVSMQLMQDMNRTMIHRGPDDEGYYIAGSVGLAMRRLSIIDLGGGHQPLSNEDSSIWIVFNGEIYNYQELQTDLEKRGHKFRTCSDTEAIVHLYEEYGRESVTYLNGMFAFAIWDSRERQVFVARDRLGIKPLFYCLDAKGNFFFASEIKALLKTSVDRAPNCQALYDYASLMYTPTPETAFSAIKKLEPATILTCSENGLTKKTYWDIPTPPAGEEDHSKTSFDEEIINLIETAVRRQMISDVPIGALLSAGLDSTTISAIMARKLNAPLKTFTIGFQHKSYDESSEARFVAHEIGSEHVERMVNPFMVGSIENLLAFFDEPFADYSAIPTYLVSKMAAERVRVVLTGDGGDEVFAGYPTHFAFKVSRIFRMIPSWVRKNIVNRIILSLPTSFERISFDYKAKRFVTGADLPFERGHYWWKVIFNEQDKQKLFTKDFLTQGFEDTFRVFDRHFKRVKNCHPLNQVLYVDAKTFLLDDNLTKVDRMTMANSLEARVPFLDHKLVERVSMIPPGIKSKGFQTKSLLRNAVKLLLPPSIQKGKKRGFTPPLPFWIRDELRTFVSDIFLEDRLARLGIINPQYCKTLLDEHLNGTRDNNRQIWTVLSLVLWLEKNSI